MAIEVEQLHNLVNSLSRAAGERDPGEVVVSEQEMWAANVLFQVMGIPRVARAIAASDDERSTNPKLPLGSYVNRENKRKTTLHIRAIRNLGGSEKASSGQMNAPVIEISDSIDFGRVLDSDGRNYLDLTKAFPEYNFSKSEVPVRPDESYMKGYYRITATRKLSLESLAKCYGDSIPLMFERITKMINHAR